MLQTKTACASFARTLSTLLQAGMPMIEAIDIAASTMTNVMYKDALMKAKSGVALGLPLSNQLKASTDISTYDSSYGSVSARKQVT